MDKKDDILFFNKWNTVKIGKFLRNKRDKTLQDVLLEENK